MLHVLKFNSTYNEKRIARTAKRYEQKRSTRRKYAQTGEFSIVAIVEWCFYIRVMWKPDWFSYWWRGRAAHCALFQFWKFQIEIGLPFDDDLLRGAFFDFKEWPKWLDEITQENEKTQWPGWLFHQVYELKNENEK